MKLIEGHSCPQGIKFFVRVLISVHPSQSIEKFTGEKSIFAVSVSGFDIRYVCITTFKDELHFTTMSWTAIHLLRGFPEKFTCCSKLNCGVIRSFIELM